MRLAEEAIKAKMGVELTVHGKARQYDPKALCCISLTNGLRVKAIWFVTWPLFDSFIMLCIVVNSIVLGMKNYDFRIVEDYDTTYNDNLEEVGLVLSIIFLIECVAKIIALGLVIHPKSYLRDAWNRLDFFVVLVSVFDFTSVNSGFLKILRMFRMLRPLRSINRLPELRKLI